MNNQSKRDVTLSTGRKSHLPLPTGPYPNIGYIDIMTGTDQNDGILVRVLYPSSNQSLSAKESHQMWSYWFPSEEYKAGYFNVANITSSIVHRISRFFIPDLHIPYVENAEPFRMAGHTFPVIIFSHGLASCRTTYSSICYELVSYGFIVFVLEHRDGSACTSFHPSNEGTEPFKWVSYKHKSEFADEWMGRSEQLDIRVDDVRKVIDLINDLQNGNEVKNLLEPKIISERYTGLFDVDNIVMMGHSFGSATTIRTLHTIEDIKLGICLDAWMYALKEPTLVTKPILFVNMETFQFTKNLNEMKKYIGSDGKNTKQRKVLTVKEAQHSDQSDFPFLLNFFVKWITKMNSKVDPFIVHDLSTALTLQFIEDMLQIKLKQNKNEFIEKYRNHLKEGIDLQ